MTRSGMAAFRKSSKGRAVDSSINRAARVSERLDVATRETSTPPRDLTKRVILMKTLFTITILLAGAVCAQTSADRAFLKTAAEGGMDEVKLGELAQANGMSTAVKEFGAHMVADHSKMGEQVKNLAASKNISLPTSITILQEASYKLLQAKNGESFDKAYITAMVKDHKADIAEFQKEADSGSDPDIKALAAQALPTLKEHLRMAENAARELGISATTGE